jgi:hypothetical protein
MIKVLYLLRDCFKESKQLFSANDAGEYKHGAAQFWKSLVVSRKSANSDSGLFCFKPRVLPKEI